MIEHLGLVTKMSDFIEIADKQLTSKGETSWANSNWVFPTLTVIVRDAFLKMKEQPDEYLEK
jgi:hypothetical protein